MQLVGGPATRWDVWGRKGTSGGTSLCWEFSTQLLSYQSSKQIKATPPPPSKGMWERNIRNRLKRGAWMVQSAEPPHSGFWLRWGQDLGWRDQPRVRLRTGCGVRLGFSLPLPLVLFLSRINKFLEKNSKNIHTWNRTGKFYTKRLKVAISER